VSYAEVQLDSAPASPQPLVNWGLPTFHESPDSFFMMKSITQDPFGVAEFVNFKQRPSVLEQLAQTEVASPAILPERLVGKPAEPGGMKHPFYRITKEWERVFSDIAKTKKITRPKRDSVAQKCIPA